MNNSDYQVVITNLNAANMPISFDEQYEFIIIDNQCNDTNDIILHCNGKFTNYNWIILNLDSSKVSFVIQKSNELQLICL